MIRPLGGCTPHADKKRRKRNHAALVKNQKTLPQLMYQNNKALKSMCLFGVGYTVACMIYIESFCLVSIHHLPECSF